MLAEALQLIEEGVISVEDLDKTVKDGLGLRWAFMGAFETIELNAPEGYQIIFPAMGRFLPKWHEVPPGQRFLHLKERKRLPPAGRVSLPRPRLRHGHAGVMKG